HRGQAGRRAEPAETPQARRALGGRVGRGGSHLRRQGVRVAGEREHLHPPGKRTSPAEQGQRTRRTDRSTVRQLSGRRRHRAPGGCLRPFLTVRRTFPERMVALPWQGWLTIAVVVATLGMLLWERLTPDKVLAGAALLLMASGVLTPKEALAGFWNPGVLTVAVLFVLVAALKS